MAGSLPQLLYLVETTVTLLFDTLNVDTCKIPTIH